MNIRVSAQNRQKKLMTFPLYIEVQSSEGLERVNILRRSSREMSRGKILGRNSARERSYKEILLKRRLMENPNVLPTNKLLRESKYKILSL